MLLCSTRTREPQPHPDSVRSEIHEKNQDHGHSQHRHHRPHRRRQDHRHRAHPVLHRPVAQTGRGARRRSGHGLDAGRTGARHHDHLGRDLMPLEGLRDPHHRHPGARGLHDRGRTIAAGARRRGGSLQRGRRGGAPVRNRVAPGRQVPRPENRLSEQNGPDRRRLLRHGRGDEDQARRQPARAADPGRDGRGLPRCHRPDPHAADHLGGRVARRGLRRDGRHPGGHGRDRGRVPRAAGRARWPSRTMP